MKTDSFTYIKDILYAQLCYQLFITPVHLPLDKKYRQFAQMACEFIEEKRSELVLQTHPRHYVLHRFTPKKASSSKKILLAHGWISRAAYMIRFIKTLHQQGYDVYALDFPAHGEALGLQLPWADAVLVLKQVMNEHGPFYGVIGHSFGGSMLLNSINLSGQLLEWRLTHPPERVILMASPTHMRSPVAAFARRFKLSGHGYQILKQLFKQQNLVDTELVQLNRFISQALDIPFLCIHGEQDSTISPKESISFCQHYPNAHLSLLPDADHVSVLMDSRVEHLVSDFLNKA